MKNTETKKTESNIVHPEWGKLEEKYWADTTNAAFAVSLEVEKEGKWEPVPVLINGYPKMSRNGKYEYVSEEIKFTPFHYSAGMTNKLDDHSWSFYNVFEKTPPYIKKRLLELNAKRAVFTNDEKMKKENPAHFEQYKVAKALKTENKQLKAQTIELQAKLKQLEGKK